MINLIIDILEEYSSETEGKSKTKKIHHHGFTSQQEFIKVIGNVP